MDVQGKIVMISGATGGLGVPTVQRFLKAGAKVAALSRDQKGLEGAFSDLKGQGSFLGIPDNDVTDPDSMAAAVRIALDYFNHIDALLNLAGGYVAGNPVHETDPGRWDFGLSLNARSVFVASRAVIPAMIEAGKGGRIVNISASSALKGKKNSAIQSAAKAAVLRLTESMAEELKEERINVNALIPTIFDTPANRESMPKAKHKLWPKPENLADVMIFLVSDAGSAVNGAAIEVPGYA
jgi:NAD(P)-dependent dehydrogenase (short-subunit alcohol dehydrogenase family)